VNTIKSANRVTVPRSSKRLWVPSVKRFTA
jgi:hypothetical protein